MIPVLPSAKADEGAERAPDGSGFECLLAGALLTVAVVAIVVRLLGAVGLLTTPVLVGVLVAAAIGATIVLRARGISWRLPWRRAVSLETLPLLAVATAAIALAIAAAYLLPVWQWDALGYHLPYVNFALQRGTFADIPDDVAYLSTYPHIVEYAFIAWRALLPMIGSSSLPTSHSACSAHWPSPPSHAAKAPAPTTPWRRGWRGSRFPRCSCSCPPTTPTSRRRRAC